ncbi:uncharacterized protein JCM6883_000801 [Sporobolomyces salmoneus]|uniref:uncharacterized protein n=1 Tax=Sporobolomyces salmoneus TaxID=183962 RepID=UPI003176A798
MSQLRTLTVLCLTLISHVFAQSSSSSITNSTSLPAASSTPTATSVPYFTIPNTFTPPASGPSGVPGSVVTITNGPYYSDTFSYTAALSTVQPTGNITRSDVAASQGGAGGSTGLQPDPTNLQTAAARRNFDLGTSSSNVFNGAFAGLSIIVFGIMTGIGFVAL